MDFPNNNNNNCGCILYATKRFDKTAAKLDKRFKKSTTIKVWSIHKFLVYCIIMIHIMPLIYNTSVDSAPTISKELTDYDKSSINSLVLKRRVRKHNRSNDITHQLDWENPCGPGRYAGRENPLVKRKSIDYHFKNLRRSINDFRKHAFQVEAINISDIKEWMGHNKEYKFLARVKPQSNTNLTRWHRNMQVYVASFSYFRHRQHYIYEKKSTKTNKILLKELDQLFVAARGILCSIESTINSTQINNHKNTNNNDHINVRHTNYTIKTIPHDEMKRRLKFRTKNRYFSSNSNEIEELDDIDLKFIKERFNETTYGMVRTLNRAIRENKCNKTNLSKNLSISDNNNNSMNSNSLYNSKNNSGSTESNEKIMKMCQRLRRRRKFERSKSKHNNHNKNNSGSSSVI